MAIPNPFDLQVPSSTNTSVTPKTTREAPPGGLGHIALRCKWTHPRKQYRSLPPHWDIAPPEEPLTWHKSTSHLHHRCGFNISRSSTRGNISYPKQQIVSYNSNSITFQHGKKISILSFLYTNNRGSSPEIHILRTSFRIPAVHGWQVGNGCASHS